MEALKSYDVVVIGGGINGAGIARDASLRGLKTALFEAKDFGQATSSNSSKLIHGGLRYLEYYEFSLVRKALKERKVLKDIAPHIIWPLQFTLPHQKHLRSKWLIRLGLFLYDFLAPFSVVKFSKMVSLLKRKSVKPFLKTGFTYYDYWVDDARLVIANIMSAKQAGADVFRDCAVQSINFIEDKSHYEITLEHGEQIVSKTCVNAAGPWADEFFKSNKTLKLVTGSHIIVPKIFNESEGAYILQNEDKRIVFAIPYEGHYTLIGTTDELYQGNPYDVSISQSEIDYLIKISNTYFSQEITQGDIVWTYSGVRPLIDDGAKNLSAVTRDYHFEFDQGRLDIFGGKLTTYRVLAEEAVDQLCNYLNHNKKCITGDRALPGGGFEDLTKFTQEKIIQYEHLPESLITRYARLYGARLDEIIANLGEELGEGVFTGEIDYTIQNEFVKSADDFLWRRTKLGLHINETTKEKIISYLKVHI